MTLEEFTPIVALAPGAATSVKMYVGFGSKLRPAKFDLATEKVPTRPLPSEKATLYKGSRTFKRFKPSGRTL